MPNRLIALDKIPCVQPIEIDVIWHRLLAKTLTHIANLEVQLAGLEVKLACGTDQLRSGIKTGIEGVIRAATKFLEEHIAYFETGFLLIDAKNWIS